MDVKLLTYLLGIILFGVFVLPGVLPQHNGYGHNRKFKGVHALLNANQACRVKGGECVNLDNCDLTLNVYKDHCAHYDQVCCISRRTICSKLYGYCTSNETQCVNANLLVGYNSMVVYSWLNCNNTERCCHPVMVPKTSKHYRGGGYGAGIIEHGQFGHNPHNAHGNSHGGYSSQGRFGYRSGNRLSFGHPFNGNRGFGRYGNRFYGNGYRSNHNFYKTSSRDFDTDVHESPRENHQHQRANRILKTQNDHHDNSPKTGLPIYQPSTENIFKNSLTKDHHLEPNLQRKQQSSFARIPGYLSQGSAGNAFYELLEKGLQLMQNPSGISDADSRRTLFGPLSKQQYNDYNHQMKNTYGPSYNNIYEDFNRQRHQEQQSFNPEYQQVITNRHKEQGSGNSNLLINKLYPEK